MQSRSRYLNKQFYSLFHQEPMLLMLIRLGQVDTGSLCYWGLDSPGYEGLSSDFWLLLGYDPAASAQLPSLFAEVINRDDKRSALKLFRQHRDDPSLVYDQVVRYRHKNGSTVWVRWRGQVSCDQRGKPIWMIAVYTDVTDSMVADSTPLKNQTRAQRSHQSVVGQPVPRLEGSAEGVVSVCANCKKVHDKLGGWRLIESFVTEYSNCPVSHGICPDCSDELYPGLLNKH